MKAGSSYKNPGIGNIRNVIFDLGGVIINLDNKRTENAFAALGAKAFSSYFGHGFAASFFADYEVGKISDQEFVEAMKQMIGREIPDQTIMDAWNALLLDFPSANIELLAKLKDRYRLFLFSNTNSMHLDALRAIFNSQFPGRSLDNFFEKAYYSHILRMRKPDRASFEYIINENNLDPASTLFVDDAFINVEGANAAGLQGYFLEKGKSIVEIDWEWK
ncbi:MAG: HAD family hydrolase [Chitinophagales bacterium]